MSFNKIVLSTIAAVAVTASAFAGTVTLSADGKGDNLVYPAYYATTNGWSTNIRVVNTNTTHAVVAKVVIRGYSDSAELLDFPIYLSPGDVWTADLVNNGSDSSVSIASTDDSSVTVPMNQTLFAENTASGKSTHGYVEILGVTAALATDIDATWTQYTPLAKADIKASYLVADRAIWNEGVNSLFGQQVVTDTTTGSEKSMTLAATAFNVTYDSAAEELGRNIDKATVFATDTTADTIFFGDVDAQIRNSILKTDAHIINYVDGVGETQLLLTQVTKHTNPDVRIDEFDVVPYYDTTDAEKTATGSNAKFYYMDRAWDESENTFMPEGSDFSGSDVITTATPCITEICYIYASDNQYLATSGWVDYALGTDANGANQSTVGIPTISTVMTGVSVNGAGIVNMLPSAYTAGTPDN